jgi:hypothetical protein
MSICEFCGLTQVDDESFDCIEECPMSCGRIVCNNCAHVCGNCSEIMCPSCSYDQYVPGYNFQHVCPDCIVDHRLQVNICVAAA